MAFLGVLFLEQKENNKQSRYSRGVAMSLQSEKGKKVRRREDYLPSPFPEGF